MRMGALKPRASSADPFLPRALTDVREDRLGRSGRHRVRQCVVRDAPAGAHNARFFKVPSRRGGGPARRRQESARRFSRTFRALLPRHLDLLAIANLGGQQFGLNAALDQSSTVPKPGLRDKRRERFFMLQSAGR